MKSYLTAALVALSAFAISFTSASALQTTYLDTDKSGFTYNGIVTMKLADTSGGTINCSYAEWVIPFKNTSGLVKARHFLFKGYGTLQANPWRNNIGDFLAFDLSYNTLTGGYSTSPYSWWIMPDYTSANEWDNFIAYEFDPTTDPGGSGSDNAQRYVIVKNVYGEVIAFGEPMSWTYQNEIVSIWAIPSCFDDSTNFVHNYEWINPHAGYIWDVDTEVLDTNDDTDFYGYEMDLVKVSTNQT